MKEGMSLDSLTAEVRRQAQVRQDHIFSTHELKLLTHTGSNTKPPLNNHNRDEHLHKTCSHEQVLLLSGSDSNGNPNAGVGTSTVNSVKGVSSGSHTPCENCSPPTSLSWLSTPAGWLTPTPLALEQMAGHVGMPLRYFRKLQQENPNLLDLNINTLLLGEPRPRLVRTLDGQIRAFLSNRYRRLDNDALLEALWLVFDDLGGLEVGSVDLSPHRLFLKMVSPRLMADVRVGDPVQAGLVISNSEVGAGAITIELLIYRLVCTNGAIIGQGAGQMRRYHTGRVLKTGPGSSSLLDDAGSLQYQLPDSPDQENHPEKPDRLFWAQLQQAARAALNEEHFHAVLERMQFAASQRVEADAKTVTERLAARFGLRESERALVELRYLESEDLTQWGLANAITRSSQEVESYERATELERLGGNLLHLSSREWRGLSLN